MPNTANSSVITGSTASRQNPLQRNPFCYQLVAKESKNTAKWCFFVSRFGSYSAHTITKIQFIAPKCERSSSSHSTNSRQNLLCRTTATNGLRTETRRRFKGQTTDSTHKLPVAPNLLNQEFIAEEKDQIRLTDITYVKTDQGWLYPAVVLDLYSRRIIGWAMSASLHRQLVIDSLQPAINARKPLAGLLHHSDRGSQYASAGYQAVLTRGGMIGSMMRNG